MTTLNVLTRLSGRSRDLSHWRCDGDFCVLISLAAETSIKLFLSFQEIILLFRIAKGESYRQSTVCSKNLLLQVTVF